MNSKYNLPNIQKVTIIEHVDTYIEGDKVLGDKINGDTYEIKTVGNLNIQGNQAGETSAIVNLVDVLGSSCATQDMPGFHQLLGIAGEICRQFP